MARDNIVGVFRGFRQGGLEFQADLVLPYQSSFQSIPMHGQFLLVQLETSQEAVLGRIASFSSEGKLSYGPGEEFNLRALKESRAIPEDLREQYLKYKVHIRVLGVMRQNGQRLSFVSSHRRLPHVGSPVAFPDSEVLREIAGHYGPGRGIGYYALGEYIYAGERTEALNEPWMQIKEPDITVRFDVSQLVSRRTFIFARAGFGKSNLNKFLFSQLYETTPCIEKGGGRQVPVGTLLFDPEGEYFWPDEKGRPGLCDVPELKDTLVVFTERNTTSQYYRSFVAGGIKLDIRRLRPSDVLAIALDPDRQEQQNVRKLKGMDQLSWERLVELIDRDGNQGDLGTVKKLMRLEAGQEVEALAARANMTAIVRSIHDRESQLLDMLIAALSRGKLCVVDVSQMRRGQSMILSAIILRKIFDRNQEHFTQAQSKTIPVLAVVEEAQAVLQERLSAADPYMAWVKEGRKYDLGAILITQQPGSIDRDILSQGDNWFVFHLLSGDDLYNLKRANAHFSDDILSSLLNEPIPGQGVFWSSVGGKPYPVFLRVFSFEDRYEVLDPSYDKKGISTFARQLKKTFMMEGQGEDKQGTYDYKESLEQKLIEQMQKDRGLLEKLKSHEGVPWGKLKAFFQERLPDTIENPNDYAYNFVIKALEEVLGLENDAWETYTHPRTGATYIRGL